MNTKIYNSSNTTIISDQYIVFDEKKSIYVCNVCNCNIFGKENVSLHIQGNSHKNYIIKLNKSMSVKKKFKSQFIKIYYCLFCKIFIKSTKILRCHTMLHLYEKLNIPSETDIIRFNFESTELRLKCLLCDIFLSNISELSNHLDTSLHLNRLIIFSCVKDDIISDGFVNVEVDINNFKNIEYELKKNQLSASLCRVCDLAMFHGNINVHINGKRHINSLKNFKSKIYELQKENLIINTSKLYTCFICKILFSNGPDLLKHYKQSDHERTIKFFLMIYNNFHMKFINFENKEIIQCVLCNINMDKCNQAIKHILGKTHNKQLKFFYLKQNDELNNKFNKLSLNIKNIDYSESIEYNIEKIDDMQNAVVQFKHHNLQTKKLNCDRKMKNIIKTKNTNYSLNNLIHNFGEIFIILCIDSGIYNIYNINEEKINLMKFGFKLIFPLHQINKFICIFCNKKVLNKQLLFEHLQDDEHIKHLKKIKNDKVLKQNKKQFTKLKFAEFCMVKISKKIIQCYACNIKIQNNSNLVDLHIRNEKHICNCQLWKEQSVKILEEFLMIFDNVWYYAQVYICAICQQKFNLEIKFVQHLIDFTHLNNVKCIEDNGTIVEFHICPVCVTYWYGKSSSYSVHCENSFHKYFVERGDLMVPSMSNFAINLLNNIDQNVNFLLNESNKVILEQNKESEVLKAIEETVKFIYPNVKSYIFGSRLSRTGFPDSDLDIFLDCDNLYYECTAEETMKKYLISVSKYFKKESNIWMINEIILDTRIPIIKLRHISTGIKIDISFSGLSVEKSKLIRYYNDAYFICRNLMLYLKKWFCLSQIPGSFGIPTYAISWYVIFYLQIKGILPSVFELIRLENKSKIVSGWECGFYEIVTAIYSELSFKDHIKEFFSYYADFDYKTNVICPYLGKLIKKNSFVYSEQLPIEMEIYKRNLIQNRNIVFQYDSPMCIQDPIDLSQNITKHITKHQLKCFRQYCHESAAKISHA